MAMSPHEWVVGRVRRTRWGAPTSVPVLSFTAAMALVLTVVSLGLAFDAHALRHGARTTGRITAVAEQRVQVEFEAGDDDVECETTHVRGPSGLYDVVAVRYDVDDPEDTCALGGAGESYTPSFAVGVAALLCAGWSVAGVRRRRRDRRAAYGDEERGWLEGW